MEMPGVALFRCGAFLSLLRLVFLYNGVEAGKGQEDRSTLAVERKTRLHCSGTVRVDGETTSARGLRSACVNEESVEEVVTVLLMLWVLSLP